MFGENENIWLCKEKEQTTKVSFKFLRRQDERKQLGCMLQKWFTSSRVSSSATGMCSSVFISVSIAWGWLGRSHACRSDGEDLFEDVIFSQWFCLVVEILALVTLMSSSRGALWGSHSVCHPASSDVVEATGVLYQSWTSPPHSRQRSAKSTQHQDSRHPSNGTDSWVPGCTQTNHQTTKSSAWKRKNIAKNTRLPIINH